ncbi:MAG: radical SAM protein [Deltaproteobacteria bacterium]|nr:radical SAM protein [Kofleriaceae bacterium]
MPNDLALVFPPHWYHPFPPHELAALAAHARAEGKRVWALDANMGGFLHCLAPAFLARCGERVGEPELGRSVAADAARAQEVVRDPARFYDPDLHATARDALAAAWRLVSRAHAPTEVDLTMLRFAGDVQDLATCRARATSEAENPFYGYLRDVVVPSVIEADARAVIVLFVHPDQLVSLVALGVELRRAGWRRPIVVAGSLEDQVNFARLLRADRHAEYPALAELFDAVVAFEAEPALGRLLDEGGGLAAAAPNVLRFAGDRLVRPASYQAADMNRLATPDFGDLPASAYPFPHATVSILGSRGCYWERCTFCAISKNQLSFRARDPRRFADDVARLAAERGVRWFALRDQLASPAWLRRFSADLVTRGLDVRWSCRTRFDRALRRDVLELAHRAGCRQLWLGLESASDAILERMDKGIRLADVARILDDCDEIGMGVHLFTMHGFPGEADADAEATVRFVEEHADRIDSIDYIDFIWFSDTPLFTQRAGSGAPPLDDDGRRVFHYRFEHRTPAERRGQHAHAVELHARIERAVPMPLVHQTHVQMFVDHHGTRGWRALRGRMAHAPTPCCELASGGSTRGPVA